MNPSDPRRYVPVSWRPDQDIGYILCRHDANQLHTQRTRSDLKNCPKVAPANQIESVEMKAVTELSFENTS